MLLKVVKILLLVRVIEKEKVNKDITVRYGKIGNFQEKKQVILIGKMVNQFIFVIN